MPRAVGKAVALVAVEAVEAPETPDEGGVGVEERLERGMLVLEARVKFMAARMAGTRVTSDWVAGLAVEEGTAVVEGGVNEQPAVMVTVTVGETPPDAVEGLSEAFVLVEPGFVEVGGVEGGVSASSSTIVCVTVTLEEMVDVRVVVNLVESRKGDVALRPHSPYFGSQPSPHHGSLEPQYPHWLQQSPKSDPRQCCPLRMPQDPCSETTRVGFAAAVDVVLEASGAVEFKNAVVDAGLVLLEAAVVEACLTVAFEAAVLVAGLVLFVAAVVEAGLVVELEAAVLATGLVLPTAGVVDAVAFPLPLAFPLILTPLQTVVELTPVLNLCLR